jgi:DNA ligase-1
MKPMLAAPVDDLSRLRYPLLASPKLDGIRCVVFGGVAMSRSMKPIPNKHVQRLLSAHPSWEGLDGELIVGPPTAKDCFQRTSSGVMSVDGDPEVIYHVFDKWQHRISDKCDPFNHRLMLAAKVIAGHKHAVLVRHVNLLNEAALLHYEAEKLAAGYEGVMLRDPAGEYKAGRSTLREGGLLKLKRFEDSEAEVLGYQLLATNENPAVRNELGYLERSSKKEGLTTLPLIGALHVRDLKTKVEFDIGTGFTSGQRADLYRGRNKLKGKLVKYKFQPTGVKDKPRFPVFIGFRDARDL